MLIRKHFRLITLGAACVAIGAGASAIATAGASGPSTATAARHAVRGRSGLRRTLKRAAHGDLQVATKTGFVTVSFDRGVVKSVSGQQLTLTEGRKSTTKTVTLTIPASARVRVNRHKSTLANVTAGQHAVVLQAPKRTIVIARTRRGG
jgi:hypothetical protein